MKFFKVWCDHCKMLTPQLDSTCTFTCQRCGKSNSLCQESHGRMTKEEVADFLTAYKQEISSNDPIVLVENPLCNDIRKSLSRLCHLKLHKDVNGKDEYYRREQPKAWDEAFKLLGIK